MSSKSKRKYDSQTKKLNLKQKADKLKVTKN